MLRRGLAAENATQAMEEDALNIELNMGQELEGYTPDGSACEFWAVVYLLNETDGSMERILNVRRR
jgi:hypothetical protein